MLRHVIYVKTSISDLAQHCRK